MNLQVIKAEVSGKDANEKIDIRGGRMGRLPQAVCSVRPWPGVRISCSALLTVLVHLLLLS